MLKSHLQLQMNCYSISLIKCMEKKWNTPNPNERTIYKIRIKSFTVDIPVILKLNVLNKFSYLKTQETQIK